MITVSWNMLVIIWFGTKNYLGNHSTAWPTGWQMQEHSQVPPSWFWWLATRLISRRSVKSLFLRLAGSVVRNSHISNIPLFAWLMFVGLVIGFKTKFHPHSLKVCPRKWTDVLGDISQNWPCSGGGFLKVQQKHSRQDWDWGAGSREDWIR